MIFIFLKNTFCLPYPENEVSKLKNVLIKENLTKQVFINTEFTISNGKLQDFLVNNVDLALGHFSDSSDKARNILCTKVVDAMSMKIPVLSRYTTATEEHFDINNDLYVFEPNANSIANSILLIQSDPIEASRRSGNGYAKWNLSFTKESFMLRFDEAIRKSLNIKL